MQGCRLPAGGGKVDPGAMPFSHRWLGNPMFSFLARAWFNAPVHDIFCGMRGFTKDLFQRLDQRCTGMEFATEMIIKASLNKEKSSRSQSPCIGTAGRRGPHTLGLSATAGGPYASS